MLFLILAWNACPNDVGDNGTCLNTTDWRAFAPYNIKMTTSKRRASTVFGRTNYTILDVIDLSDPIPVNYTAEDFFTFYDVIFQFNSSQPDFYLTTQFQFLLSISSFLVNNHDQP